MATQDARSTTLRDFGVDPSAAAHGHSPSLHPHERFVRCRACGATAPYSVTAVGPIRRALNELASVPCDRYELPDVPVGDHVPIVTPEHPTRGRSVVCESCGRSSRLDGDRERILEALADVPCSSQLSRSELVDLVISPTEFTPLLSDFGIENWYGRLGGHHDGEIVRQFRHERCQYTVYVRERSDDSHVATLSTAPNTAVDPVDELRFSEPDSDSGSGSAAVTLVTFLSATDPLTANEFAELHAAYEDAYRGHRSRWLDDAYDRARGSFRERFDASPEAFTDAFSDTSADVPEVLRRMIGSDGFTDLPESEFAVEILGHEHAFPGFIEFVADRHCWSLPVPET